MLYMKQLFMDMPFVRTYLDDILVCSENKKVHYSHLKKILERLVQHQHTINWEKSVFAQPEIQWVGHLLTKDGVLPTDTTKGQIQLIANPRDKDEVRQFLGHVGYIQDHIANYSHGAAPAH